jgi:hypothetical protein
MEVFIEAIIAGAQLGECEVEDLWPTGVKQSQSQSQSLVLLLHVVFHRGEARAPTTGRLSPSAACL